MIVAVREARRAGAVAAHAGRARRGQESRRAALALAAGLVQVDGRLRQWPAAGLSLLALAVIVLAVGRVTARRRSWTIALVIAVAAIAGKAAAPAAAEAAR